MIDTRRASACFLLSLLLAVVACEGGTTGGPADGGTSGSSGTSGTSDAPPPPCTAFVEGEDVGVAIGGSPASRTIVQTVSHAATLRTTIGERLVASCTAIATGLDADAGKLAEASAMTDAKQKVGALCRLAVTSIQTTKAKAGSLRVTVDPPRCQLAIADKAACQASCSGAPTCDVKANPFKCTGGKLFGACNGTCTSEAGALLTCRGGTCAGSCTGTCNGQPSNGTTCEGVCNGQCSSSCSGMPVVCDGKCNADFTPGACEGGRLEGGCRVDAKCDGACDFDTAGKAKCPTGPVVVSVSGGSDAAAASKLQATLEARLPAHLALEAQLEELLARANLLASALSSATDIEAACIPKVATSAATSLEALTSDAQAAASVLGAIQ